MEVCDPSPVCLGRFSRFVSKFHRCPGLRDDPAGYLSFVEKLLAERAFDVLLPVHEQGFAFARTKARFETRVGLALPAFESYRIAHSKAGFSRLLDELRLPQPATRIVTSSSELRDAVRFPCVVKTSIGTASRGIWFVRDEAALTMASQELGAKDAFADAVLVQDLVAGATEKAQAVFSHGNLLGFHAYKQIAAGAGGGEAVKQSVRRPGVRADIATIGERLGWHGALLGRDIIMPEEGDHLLYRLQPASGRADGRLSASDSIWSICCFAFQQGKTSGARARTPVKVLTADPSRHAGVAWLRSAGRIAARGFS